MDQPTVVAQLVITMDSSGQLSITGPIDNKMLAYGMLEIAKEVVCEHGKKAQQRIQLAPAAMADLLKRQ